ncbi:hypothetical protein A6U86_27650 [Rhizobium sp. AC27/96]|nr:hypothetical protein A6U86_27650 [Rhizobium sp. AC27/96]
MQVPKRHVVTGNIELLIQNHVPHIVRDRAIDLKTWLWLKPDPPTCQGTKALHMPWCFQENAIGRLRLVIFANGENIYVAANSSCGYLETAMSMKSKFGYL